MKKYHDKDNDKSVQRVSPVDHEGRPADFSGKRYDIKLENAEIVNNIKETKLANLTTEQQRYIDALIQKLKPLFSNVPKKATKIKHDIELCLTVKRHVSNTLTESDL